DSGLGTIVTQSSLRHALDLADGVVQVVLDDPLEADAIARCPTGELRIDGSARDLMYVIYTSGSTGRPKGVMLEHRSVVNFLETMGREPGLDAQDHLLAVTTLSFDIAGLELWLPLLVGARVIVATRAEASDPQLLQAALERHAVTVMQATPATWRMLTE